MSDRTNSYNVFGDLLEIKIRFQFFEVGQTLFQSTNFKINMNETFMNECLVSVENNINFFTLKLLFTWKLN